MTPYQRLQRTIADLRAVLTPAEREEFDRLHKRRTQLQKRRWASPANYSAVELKQRADRLRTSRRRPPHPPSLIFNPNERMSKLHCEIRELERSAPKMPILWLRSKPCTISRKTRQRTKRSFGVSLLLAITRLSRCSTSSTSNTTPLPMKSRRAIAR